MLSTPSRRTLILAGAAVYVAQLIGCPAVSTAVGIVQLVTYTGYNRTALSEHIQARGGALLT